MKNNNSDQETPVAGLIAFNLAPQQSAVGFQLSGNNLTNTALSYTNYTGGYLGIYTGARSVTAIDANTNSTLASTDYIFEKDKYYSLFLVGDTTYQNIIVDDKIDSLSGNGKAYIRYINAIADAGTPVVNISENGNSLINDNAAFKNVSAFVAATPGAVSISVNNNGNIQAQRSITLEERKVYTALLIGVPGSTDSLKSVQIRYIENGTLSADTTATGQGFSRVNPSSVKIN
ncbi:MAG: DUF4397 domain-containing protein [Chitinophagaceae bacterium]|nr:DUF4397 domain-containing protein [Chitinophagaceae bacterium]